MTYAPACLMGARTYLMSRGVPGASLGIVGDADHKSSGGYHCGNDWLADVGKLYTDYSKRESSRDRPGSNAAMGFDIGGLSDAALWALNQWIVSQCQAGAPWTQDIREVIYWHAPTNTIRRWDRLGIRTGGDWSHRFHTHLSYFRDSEGRDKTELFQRYYEPHLFVPPPPPPAKKKVKMESYLYNKTGTNTYALLTPGAPDCGRWLETDDYEVAVSWAVKHGNAKTISVAGWNDLKAQAAPLAA